ncbi:MFS transporter, partial [Burkholderia sp. SIMBA_019]|uniref:MFS transporter n=1 Tax=Burkholderia sp. SIMBA_019 TaxID=3085765 RepID=UPI003978A604
VAVGLLSLTGSWRAMFYILGAAGLIVLVFFMRIFTDRPETNPRVSPAELQEIQASRAQAAAGQDEDAPALPWWSFFRSKTLVLNTLGYFSFMYVNFLLLT